MCNLDYTRRAEMLRMEKHGELNKKQLVCRPVDHMLDATGAAGEHKTLTTGELAGSAGR